MSSWTVMCIVPVEYVEDFTKELEKLFPGHRIKVMIHDVEMNGSNSSSCEIYIRGVVSPMKMTKWKEIYFKMANDRGASIRHH